MACNGLATPPPCRPECRSLAAAVSVSSRPQSPRLDTVSDGSLDPPHRAVGRDDDVGSQQVQVLAHERVEMPAADLLLAFEQELDVDRQAPGRGEERLGDDDRNEHRTLVVGDTTAVEPPVAQRRGPRRAGPFLERIGWLHVVVAVDQHGAMARCAQPLAVDDRMAAGRNRAHLERPGRRHLGGHPARRPVDVGAVRRVGADAGDRGELDQLAEAPIVVRPKMRQHPIVGRHLPPSTDSTCPVIHPAYSEAKNSTA